MGSHLSLYARTGEIPVPWIRLPSNTYDRVWTRASSARRFLQRVIEGSVCRTAPERRYQCCGNNFACSAADAKRSADIEQVRSLILRLHQQQQFVCLKSG